MQYRHYFPEVFDYLTQHDMVWKTRQRRSMDSRSCRICWSGDGHVWKHSRQESSRREKEERLMYYT